MNILVIIGKNKIGMLRTIRGAEKCLNERGFSFYYLLSEEKHLQELGFKSDKVNIIKKMNTLLKFPGGILAFLGSLKGRKAINAWDIDVIYNYTVSTLPFCILLSKISGIPYITAVRNVYEGDTKRFKKYMLHRAKNILAVSKDTMNCVEEFLGDRAVNIQRFIVHNALDVEYFQSFSNAKRPEEYASFPIEDPIIGMVSAMNPEKDPRFLLRVSARVIDRHKNARFVFIGGFANADYKEKTHNLVNELKLGDNAFFIGPKNPIAPYFLHMDILAHPSPARRESFGLVLIEAMSYGKPVISSRIGGIPEVVEDGSTGILCNPGNEEEFADAIIKLIEDNEQRKMMGARGKERVQKMFSMERLADDLERIFNQISKSKA